MTAIELGQSHRERKKLATRRAIHEAAFDLVEEHGLAGVTVEAISEQAGVAPRTFWSYFGSKEDAILDRDPRRPEALRQAVLDRPSAEAPMTALRRVLEADLHERMADPEKAWRRGQLVRREPHLMATVAAVFDEVERALESGLADRLGRDADTDLLPGVLASAATGACRIALQRWSDQRGQVPLFGLIDEAFTQLAGGLRHPNKKAAR